jgi:hypothetical protein
MKVKSLAAGIPRLRLPHPLVSLANPALILDSCGPRNENGGCGLAIQAQQFGVARDGITSH